LRLGTFIFPTVADPARDAAAIEESVDEAVATEALGLDAVWLAEHHFDGMCAYVDPLVFAATVAAKTSRVDIGFAVVQASLHHPLRLAEQIALLDHLTRGRLIAGLGRGSMYYDYEYEAFEIAPQESGPRHDEVEEILLKCFAGGRVRHAGRFWNFDIPMLRPRPYTRPHPRLLRAVATEASTIKHCASGRPFLFAGPADIIARRVETIRATMRAQGRDEAHIAGILDASWAWQHVVLAPTDAEAHRAGIAYVRGYIAYREALNRKSTLAEFMRAAVEKDRPPGGYVFGAPETVARELATFARMGIGGLIIRYDIGPMTAAQSRASLEMFAHEVAPRLRAPALEAAL
jgi:alkanesulfonate monooxygenase SsuD/methylene tetrahydromethanopterin reductase-like flavin-dependent oxidoreductase (luciferase family)